MEETKIIRTIKILTEDILSKDIVNYFDTLYKKDLILFTINNNEHIEYPQRILSNYLIKEFQLKNKETVLIHIKSKKVNI